VREHKVSHRYGLYGLESPIGQDKSAVRKAGESAADKIDWGEIVSSDVSDIRESLNAGPMLLKDFVAEGVYLDLPSGFEPRPFQTEVYPADA
jgi:hypothetical protein